MSTNTPEAAPSNAELGVIAMARYTVVRTGLWWRVRVGNGSQTVGRCFTKVAAERLASALMTAFLDGAFVAEGLMHE